MTQKSKDWFVTQLLRLVGVISCQLSFCLRIVVGQKIGDILRKLSKRRESITLDNLANAFPEKPIEWHEKICKESYRNLGITLIELLAFPSYSPDYFRKIIKFQNLELIEECAKQGKGVLLLSAHFGNWELVGASLPLFTSVPVSAVVQTQHNEFANKILNKYRGMTGNNLILKDKAAREIVKTLSKGELVGMLADQSGDESKDVYVPLFGRLAATYEAPAALALRFRSPIIIGLVERNNDGTYLVNLQKLPYDDLENNKQNVVELTRRYMAVLEQAVRKRPDLWLWQHRRWKHQKPIQPNT